jgi:hypothetical protein
MKLKFPKFLMHTYMSGISKAAAHRSADQRDFVIFPKLAELEIQPTAGWFQN